MIEFITTTLLTVILSNTDSIKDHINIRAQAYNYPVVKALLIAECESGFVPKAKSASSTASGIFQFINGTWYGVMKQMGLPTTTNKLDPRYNIEAGLFLLDKEGDRHWAASRSCWQPKYMKYLNNLSEET